jgi:hypothetical protein
MVLTSSDSDIGAFVGLGLWTLPVTSSAFRSWVVPEDPSLVSSRYYYEKVVLF